MVGNIEIEISEKGSINEEIITLFSNSTTTLNILTPYVDRFYTNEIKRLAEKGISVLVITHNRGLIPREYGSFYDELKSSDNVKIVNSPNIQCIIAFNDKKGIYSGGILDKNLLDKSILILTKINEASKLMKLKQVYNLFLPSFMRK
ncbi:MAG: hypothetical protein BAJALOKI1v1_390017 [Promethearchaeota archaeon]|nr:MAG: hypothetical protein BAJALOKI1v1_390017 [Candidatus Lokiarchaeota archaeon]